MFRRWQRRLRYWLHSRDRTRFLREEMQAHLEMMAQALVEDGMAESQARSAALRHFGNLAHLQEDSRQVWIARWPSDLLRDTALALRTLRQQPGFAAVAVLSAALGIGACSLAFSLANVALFRPLPVEEPSRLMSLAGLNLRSGKAGQSLSFPDIEDLRQARSFQGIAAYFQFVPAMITTGGEPRRSWGSLVTANYFDVVRPAFAAGRGFAPRDDQPGSPPAVVLSYPLWQSRFSADPALLGRTIELNRRKVTVVGITAPGFRGTESMFYSDFWLPFSMLDVLAGEGMGGDRLRDRGGQWLMAAGRLRPGANARTAASEIDVLGKRLASTYPSTNRERAFRIERAGQLNPGVRKLATAFFLLLLVVAALVLCTACANVANLLLARASARRKEIATRLAIGAGRGRLLRQLLTESTLLALLGGAAGYALAQFGAFAVSRSRIPLSLPVDLSLSLDNRVLLFSIALSVLTGVVFGLVPALRATRPDLTGALKGGGEPLAHLRRFGLRNLLVVAQVAICMVLLISSGLFLRSFDSARNAVLGFSHRNLLLLEFDPSLNRYTASDARRVTGEILNGVRATPGVESASLADSVPLNLEGTQNAFTREDQAAGGETRIRADIYSVAPLFFDTLGIRLLSGEDFRPGNPSGDIAILNQTAAAKAFPGENPIGRRISYLGRTVLVVGLVQTAKSRTIGEDPHPCLYFPIARDLHGNDSLTGLTLVLRTHGDPAAYAELARQAIRKADPGLAVFGVRTMEAQISRALYLPRLTALLFGLTGIVGLLISSIGLYGLISFAVARRTSEIGVRMAVGATSLQVLTMVLRQGIALTLAGSAIGLALAFAVSRTAASLLYGVSPTDAATFLAVPAFLILIAAASCLIPARRAASLDPIRALRCL